METGALNKQAMDPALKKYLSTGVAAAILSAGIGTTVSRLASEKKRKKALDLSKNRNVITVDVDIPNFMKDLPTPAQFASSKPSADAIDAAKDQLTPEAAAALKKELLRRGSGRIDFFRKAAEKSEAVVDDATKSDSDDAKQDDKSSTKTKTDSSEPSPSRLRDESGRFVSDTSPVAVKEVEKDAGFGAWLAGAIKPVTQPVVDFGKDVKDGLVESPKLIAGGITAVALAALIAKHVNKQRAASARAKLDAQRDEYIAQINGVEKEAQDQDGGTGKTIGLGAGAAFLAPFALSSLIAYKVMQNRAETQNKKSLGSFAVPPVVLYRARGDIEKGASVRTPAQRIGDAANWVGGKVLKGIGAVVDKTGIGVDAGVNRAMEIFSRPENKARMGDLAKGVMSGNSTEAFKNLLSAGDMAYMPVFASNSFKKKLLSNKKFQDMVIQMLKDKQYADSFGKIRNEAISRTVGKLVGADNEANRLLSGLVLSSGMWEPGVRQKMDSIANRYE